MRTTKMGPAWRCWAPLAVSAAVMLALVTEYTPQVPAQAKKTDKPEVTPKESKVVDVFVAEKGGLEQIRYINDLLEKQWQENKIIPSERCSDYEFIRRATLDIIGRIAKIDEINVFLAQPAERRRSLLIERLLASDEFANNWANLWTNLLLTRTAVGKLHQQQMHEWLTDQLLEKKESAKSDRATSADWSKIVAELISAQGETSDNGEVNFVLAHMGEEIKQDQAKNGKYEMIPVTSRTTRLFLGLRTQCVQCHDHPFNGEWGQHHFWGINAFYRQADSNGRPTMMAGKKKGMGMQKFALTDNANFNTKGLVPYERRSAVLLFTDATFLDGKKMPDLKETKGTRRQELAKFITSSPYFAKAAVNRTWAHFFGRSFTKDGVDDFGEHNPVSNPELLDKLSEDWAKKYGHDPRALIRWICNSRAYGLASVANKSNDKPEDEAFFSRMLLKAMSPEQLFESLMTATDAKTGQDKATRRQLREDWLDKLIVNFGDDEGNEGSFNGTVIQALLLMNGQDINTAIMDKDSGTVAFVLNKYKASQKGAQDAMRHLYMAALNRPPRPAEYAKVLSKEMWSFRTPRKMDEAFWTGYYQDLFWAILNSNEFILNH